MKLVILPIYHSRRGERMIKCRTVLAIPSCEYDCAQHRLVHAHLFITRL